MPTPVPMDRGGLQSFAASLDSTTKIVSMVVCALLFGGAIAARSLLVAILAALCLGLSYGFSPTGYMVEDRAVIVRRLAGNARISLEGIREIRQATPDDLRFCVRLFGSGGLFGYYGLFRTRKLGKSTWYVTRRRNAVVLATGAKTTLFSPDDVDGFIAAVRSTAPAPLSASDPMTSPLFETLEPEDRRRTGSMLAWAVGSLAIALSVAAMFYSPGPPPYTLTADSLTIHDRFYPVTLKRAEVDMAHLRVVDIASDPEWKPTMRTNGFANPRYRSGWFRVAGGREVRLYRAGDQRVVLLPPKGNGTPVLLDTPDPERFIRDVRTEWAAGS